MPPKLLVAPPVSVAFTLLAWKDVGRAFIIAVVLDLIYELIAYR